jgi:DNA-binding transcriptional ArsR family regulator
MAGLTHALAAQILKQMLDQSATLDLLYHALADPTRRGMVERLSRGPASVSELAQPLDMTLSAVVQHLQVL